MDYGHKPHTHRDDDLTVIYCSCGHQTKELSRPELADLGLPWYCAKCGAKNQHWLTFHPSERARAEEILHRIVL